MGLRSTVKKRRTHVKLIPFECRRETTVVSRQRCLLIGRRALLDGLRYLLAPELEVLMAPADLRMVQSAAATFQPTAAVIDLEPDGGALEIGHLLQVLC